MLSPFGWSFPLRFRIGRLFENERVPNRRNAVTDEELLMKKSLSEVYEKEYEKAQV